MTLSQSVLFAMWKCVSKNVNLEPGLGKAAARGQNLGREPAGGPSQLVSLPETVGPNSIAVAPHASRA